MRKLLIGIIILLLLVPSVVSISVNKTTSQSKNGNILYVGGSGGGNYSTIQEAINDAYDGDTVFVYDYSSPYTEHLKIIKTIILVGENKNTTKIFGNNEDKDIIYIKSNLTTLSNFTIQYGSNHNSGILIKDSSYVTINDCNFFNIPSMDAVTISNSENVNIENCLMSDSIEKSKSGTLDRYISGITLEGGCINTTIVGNTISKASYAGIIVLEGCLNTRITNNYIHSNDIYGIRAQHCDNNYIKENKISNNLETGMAIFDCNFVIIKKNSCENNKKAAVGIGDSIDVFIERNNFINNGKIGYFSNNFGEGHPNILPDILWKENYWDRNHLFPKVIFGTLIYQKNLQSPIIVFPWFMFDWHPASEPY